MPNYVVVRCANDDCAKFQSQQEKKSNKWTCVVCGLKQSLKRVYYQSSVPKECRAAVMDLNMNLGLAREAKVQAGSIAHRQRLPLSEKQPSTGAETSFPTVSKWTEYIGDDSNTSGITQLPDVELDKYNRVIVGRVEQKQPAKQKFKPTAKPAEIPKNQFALTAKPPAKQQARYSPYHVDGPSKAIPTLASEATQTLSDALVTLTQKCKHIDSAPMATNSAVNSCNKPLQLPVKQKKVSSKWEEFDNSSSSEDEVD